jgi:hypothetical protein
MIRKNGKKIIGDFLEMAKERNFTERLKFCWKIMFPGK